MTRCEWRVASLLRMLALTLGIFAFGLSGPAGASGPDTTAVDTARVRSPGGAMLRSLALPGWGQFYNRRPFKGSLIAAAEVGSAVAFFVRRDRLNGRQDGGSERNVFFFTTIGLVLFSMGDAYVDAHLDRVDWGGVEVEPAKEGVEMRVYLKVRF